MRYYKTGEFAKMANVSIRTIRYYDQKGLLKPSAMTPKGYRLYSDDDFVKLQQILSLKYLGFSLEEIFSMTIKTDRDSLKESLSLQNKLITQKISHLKAVQTSLKETESLLDSKEEIDWKAILNLIHLSTMEDDLVDQYKNSTNVEIRIRLHEKYSVNPVHWFNWLYQEYHLQGQEKILEIGCGNGSLWKMNEQYLSKDLDITLNDVSSGMIHDAKENLKGLSQFTYHQFDAHHIPYKDHSFDVVIANHVMFYLKDIPQALQEIKRVLKKGGLFYVSTYGAHHMKEIRDLTKEFNPKVTLSSVNLYDLFGFENGEEILAPYFHDITLQRYDDHLEVTDMNEIANYIISCHGNQLEYLAKDYEGFRKLLESKMKNHKFFYVTKEAGLFICRND